MIVIIRIIALPFFFGVHAIFAICMLIKTCGYFILYGGESKVYNKTDRKSIADIYEQMKQTHQIKSVLTNSSEQSAEHLLGAIKQILYGTGK